MVARNGRPLGILVCPLVSKTHAERGPMVSENLAAGEPCGRTTASTLSGVWVGLNTVMEVAPPGMSTESGSDHVLKRLGTPSRTDTPWTPLLDSISSSAATTAPVRD